MFRTLGWFIWFYWFFSFYREPDEPGEPAVMFHALAWFVWFYWFFSLIENRTNQGNQQECSAHLAGSPGSSGFFFPFPYLFFLSVLKERGR